MGVANWIGASTASREFRYAIIRDRVLWSQVRRLLACAARTGESLTACRADNGYANLRRRLFYGAKLDRTLMADEETSSAADEVAVEPQPGSEQVAADATLPPAGDTPGH